MRTTAISLGVIGMTVLFGAGCLGEEAGKTAAGIQVSGPRTTLLLDAAIAKKIRDRTATAPDPFGNSGPVVVGDKAHHDERKIGVVSGEGFFSIPVDPAGQSVVFLDMTHKGMLYLHSAVLTRGVAEPATGAAPHASEIR